MNQMNEDERTMQENVVALQVWCQTIAAIDLPELEAAIQRQHTVGPIFFPTEYRQELDTLREVEELVRLIRPVWNYVNQKQEEQNDD